MCWLEIEEESGLLFNEKSRVDAFIKGLGSKQYRSHFLIIKPSIMEEVRRTVVHITRKGQWIHTTGSKRHKSDIELYVFVFAFDSASGFSI